MLIKGTLVVAKKMTLEEFDLRAVGGCEHHTDSGKRCRMSTYVLLRIVCEHEHISEWIPVCLNHMLLAIDNSHGYACRLCNHVCAVEWHEQIRGMTTTIVARWDGTPEA